jgi:hypothetical protein
MSGQWPALALAIAVHLAFIAVLVFSLRWQNRPAEPVTVELYAPPAKVVWPSLRGASAASSSARARTRTEAAAKAGTQTGAQASCAASTGAAGQETAA